MPQIYVIVRFDTASNSKPSYRTIDITSTGLQPPLANDTTRIIKTTNIIDPSTSDTYSVAIETVKMNGRDLQIIYSTTSFAEAQNTIERIPQFVEESDKDRQKLYSGVGDIEEGEEGEEEKAVKAEVKWEGKSCVRVKLKKKSFCWYELVTVNVSDVDIGETGHEYVSEEDIARHGKRRKKKAENDGEEDTFKDEDVEMT